MDEDVDWVVGIGRTMEEILGRQIPKRQSQQ